MKFRQESVFFKKIVIIILTNLCFGTLVLSQTDINSIIKTRFVLAPDSILKYIFISKYDSSKIYFEDMCFKDNSDLNTIISNYCTSVINSHCWLKDTVTTQKRKSISIYSFNYESGISKYLNTEIGVPFHWGDLFLWSNNEFIKIAGTGQLSQSAGDCIFGLASYNSRFFPASKNYPYRTKFGIAIRGQGNQIDLVTNTIFTKSKVLNFYEIKSASLPFPVPVSNPTFYLKGPIFFDVGSQSYINYYRPDTLYGKRGYMYYWGDSTLDFKLWTIEEEWKNCVNRLAWHDDTLSFIEIWGMDTTVQVNSPYHCTLPTTLRKMTFSGQKIWEKQLPFKLHYMDVRRDKSPFSNQKPYFYLIDNYNTDSLMKGPYFNNFKLYKFDSSGNFLYSKTLKFPFDSCARASWPYLDGCGRIYSTVENYRKKPHKPGKEYTVYQLDSLGNILWSSPLPKGYDWGGAKHVAISPDNKLYLGSSKRDTMIYIKIGEPSPKIISQSNDKVTCENQAITLFVHSTAGNFNHKWQKNGKDIVGKTDSVLEFTSITSADSGNYRCIVSNCFESDTSEDIHLRISPLNYNIHKIFCNGKGYQFGNRLLDKPGNYCDTFTNYLGCDSIVKLNLNILKTVLPNDTFFCSGSSVILDAGNQGAKYLWNTLSTGKLVVVFKAGIYIVQIQTDSCTLIDTVIVVMETSPKPSLGKDSTICLNNNSLWLDAGIYTSYEWFPDGEFTRSIEIKESGLYSVKVRNDKNCSGSDTIKIINFCEPKLYVPTAFSPNGDGLNDSFLVQGLEIEEFSMIIFSRWGEKIFESNDIKQGWDGTYKGRICQVDEYFYQISANGTGSQRKTVVGTVMLMR